MRLDGKTSTAVLVARFAGERFPEAALAEIREERQFESDEGLGSPTFDIDVVLGDAGRLYVVLPTGVVTGLPMACNAPFIQDPARLKIKDPEISPVNRWLLERVGQLTASLMLDWLGSTAASIEERAAAYAFLPDDVELDDPLDHACTTYVKEAFDACIKDADVLLTESSRLVPAQSAAVIPRELGNVWSAKQTAALLDPEGRPPLSSFVPLDDGKKLVRRELVQAIGREEVVAALRSNRPPKPSTWRGLLDLWAYVAPVLRDRGPWYRRSYQDVYLLPVHGSNELHAAQEVVRLAKTRMLHSEADWEFLSSHLLVIDHQWLDYLPDQRRQAEAYQEEGLFRDAKAALDVLEAIEMEKTSDVGAVIEQVANEILKNSDVHTADRVRLAQIAAKLGAEVGDSFRFVTRTGSLESIEHPVFFDADGGLEELLPEEMRDAHLLHDDYTKSFVSCSRDEWIEWISSGRARVLQFAPFVGGKRSIWGRDPVAIELRKRGGAPSGLYPYVTNEFVIKDWDFGKDYWEHWTRLAEDDPGLWFSVVERLLFASPPFWYKHNTAKVQQVATTGNKKTIHHGTLWPGWILKLRDLPCLPDTRGVYRKPSELLRRTLETEPVMDVEDFVDKRLDTEQNEPLLTLLGVRDVPTGPVHLLDRLRALAQTEEPPAHEVEKWYRRLDELFTASSTGSQDEIRTALLHEKIMLTESHGWTTGTGVFVNANEEDVPGAAVIRTSVRELALWGRIGIAERPTADLAVAWLGSLPSGQKLPGEELRRVQSLLGRFPGRVWAECGHWLNLEGEWVPVEELRYSLSMHGLVQWKHLAPWVKKRTADFQRLTLDAIETPPFSALGPLIRSIEERFDDVAAKLHTGSEPAPWMTRMGEDLARVQLGDDETTARVRALATRLARTIWRTANGLRITPYIDGEPAGESRSADAVWLEEVLYTTALPTARLARVVPSELAKAFDNPDISAAFSYCFGRHADDVSEYLKQNFDLAPAVEEPPLSSKEEDPEESREDREDPEAGRPALVGESTETHPFGRVSDTSAERVPVEKDSGGDFVESDPEPPRRESGPSASTPAPGVEERFAASMGFRRESQDLYRHPNGSVLERVRGEPFPWHMKSPSGDVHHYYWMKNHCLERHPLDVAFEVWRLIDSFQSTHSLILVDKEGELAEFKGTDLRELVDKKKVKLYQAVYRLQYVRDD